MSIQSIKQLSGNYLIGPDRILLKISTLDDNEYLFLLTRRITSLLMHEFQNKTAPSAHPHDLKFSTSDLQELRQEIKAQQTDFNAKYQGAKKHPLGKMPYLITSFKLTQNKKKQGILKLSLRGHDSVNFFVNLQLLRIALQFLNKIQIKAVWNLEIEPINAFSNDLGLSASQKSKLH